VIAFYANLGVTADNMDVNTAVGSYRRQEAELDRWERASQQASSSLQSLQETYDQLSAELERLHAKKDKHAMDTLKMREASMRDQELAFSKSCAFLTVGMARLSSLVRKL
jgi:type I site-specific restriction endonuclease